MEKNPSLIVCFKKGSFCKIILMLSRHGSSFKTLKLIFEILSGDFMITKYMRMKNSSNVFLTGNSPGNSFLRCFMSKKYLFPDEVIFWCVLLSCDFSVLSHFKLDWCVCVRERD